MVKLWHNGRKGKYTFTLDFGSVADLDIPVLPTYCILFVLAPQQVILKKSFCRRRRLDCFRNHNVTRNIPVRVILWKDTAGSFICEFVAYY